jgi:hypothetical protein
MVAAVRTIVLDLLRMLAEHASRHRDEVLDYVRSSPRLTTTTVSLAIAIAVLGFAAFYVLAGMLPTNATHMGVWFHGDVPRVYENMFDRFSNNYRTKVHPLFPMLTHPWVFALRSLGVSNPEAVHILISAQAAAFLALFFFCLRMLNVARYAAAACTLAVAASAASIFWATVPETYLLGAITILLPLIVAGRAATNPPPPIVTTLAGAATLSVTTSNWMAGIFAAFALHQPRQAVRICFNVFFIVVIAWGVEKALYPSAVFFLDLHEELGFLAVHDYINVGPIGRLETLFFHGMFAPEFSLVRNGGADQAIADFSRATLESSSILDHGPLGFFGIGLWAIMLLLGAYSLWTSTMHDAFRIVLTLTIGGQVALHLAYGEEPFLYTLRVTPLFMLAVGYAAVRRPAMVGALALVLAATAGTYNYTRFREAIDTLTQLNPAGTTVPPRFGGELYTAPSTADPSPPPPANF